MNPTNILNDIYNPPTKSTDAAANEEATALEREVTIWSAWNQQPVTETLVQRLTLAMDKIVSDYTDRSLACTITADELRSRVIEAAVLARVIRSFSNGQYTPNT